MRRTLKFVAIYVVVSAVLIAGLEVFYRDLRERKPYYSRTLEGQSENREEHWARSDPDLGWVFSGENLHKFKNRHYRSKDWVGAPNREGFRAPRDFRDLGPKSDTKRIMLLGDSFVFGTYIKYAETLPVLLQKELGSGYETHNLGMPGWGVDQMYQAYTKYVDLIDPDIVILVFIDNDIVRVFESFPDIQRMNKPSFKVEDGKLMRRHDTEPDFMDRLAQQSRILNDIYDKIIRPRRSLRICEAILLELSKETGRRGQEFVVVRYPLKNAVLEDKAKSLYDLGGFSRRHGMTYLDPFDAMRARGEAEYRSFYLKRDSHPAMAGNRFIARYIIKEALSRD